jgi:DNA ligase-associated metallophosphoesterase
VTDAALAIELAGEQVLLHPQRALIWPAQRTAFIADLHLGKSEVFRRSGIPIPDGTTRKDLERLEEIIVAHAITRVVLLGDFVHAASDRAAASPPEYAREFSQWRAEHPHLEFIVVAGNHDRHAATREFVDAVRWLNEGWQLGPFECRHHPGTPAHGFVLSGHVHPVVKLYGSHRERARVPVCWRQRDCAVLPSFGSFTGGGDIEPQPDDELFAFAAGRVWRIPRRIECKS